MEEKNIISNWLDKLQRESWNLELLISGFSIFLLLQGGELLLKQMQFMQLHYAETLMSTMAVLLFGVAYLASKILTINLIVHVILRGIWIGTIGLRSVQEKINFEELNYTPFFTEKLKKKVPNLDQLLVRLDTICSVVFAFTFLIVFMFFSMFLFFAFVATLFLALGFLSDFMGETAQDIAKIFFLAFFLFIMFTGLLYMIDTLSLGILKKVKWLQRFYYPIYVFYGYITFAGIYRSMYYTLISRFPRKWIRAILIPYLILFALLPFHKVDHYQFYPDNSTEQELFAGQYDDQRDEETSIREASIPSMIIDRTYFPLFIRYEVEYNASIRLLCTDYEPSKSEGFISGIKIDREGFRFGDPDVEEKDPAKLLACLGRAYSIYLNDSLYTNTDFYFHRKVGNEEYGVQTMIETTGLAKGKHLLKINRKEVDEETLETTEVAYTQIPFWLE